MQVKYLLYSLADVSQQVLTAESQATLNAVSQKLFKLNFVELLKKHSQTSFTAKDSESDVQFFLK